MTKEQPHGTAGRYANGGCRCAECRAAWATYIRDRRRARGELPREVASAARRLGLTRKAGETGDAYRRRMRETRAWLRGDVYYPGKARPVAVQLTGLGAQILDAVQARTGRSPDDIFEHALRRCAPHWEFEEQAPAEELSA